MSNIILNENDSFLLGVLLKVTGLSKSDVLKIANNELMLDEDKTPSDIRNYILEDSELKVTLLRKLSNIGVNVNDLCIRFNLIQNEVLSNVDNYFYYFNTIDFKLRNSSNWRNQMIDLLLTYNIKSRDIANILDIGYTTVRNYIRDKNY
ncbi:hypothetical protein [Cetobacterium somerae]